MSIEKIAILDGRATKECIDSLYKYVDKIILTRSHKMLYEAVSYHPDMVLCPVDQETIVVAPDVEESFINSLKEANVKMIYGHSKLEYKYPGNIYYNAAIVGDYVFHNLKYTDPVLKEVLTKQNKKWIHVNQGYTKCSICVIGKEAMITADEKIANKAKEVGIDVLWITTGHIELQNMNYGFIGGATGLIDENTLGIFGDLNLHPDKEKIHLFLKKHGVKLEILEKKTIIDRGTLFTLRIN